MLWLLAFTAALAGPADPAPSDDPGPPAVEAPPSDPPDKAFKEDDAPSRAEIARKEDAEDDLDDADAVDPDDPDLVVVRTRRPVHAPCRKLLDGAEVRLLPARGPIELLHAVPGLVQTDRFGLGGPRITAWRGLTSGVGSQVALELEGVPLTEPGHLGGHGYTDGWSLPLSLVSAVDWCPGAAQPDAGPFLVGGRASLKLARPIPGWWGELGGGTDGSGRLAVRWGPRTRDAGTFLHAEVDGGEGVGAARSWRHLRLAGGITGSIETVDVAAFMLLYEGADDVAPLLREDDLLDDRVRFYGGYRDWTGRRVSRRFLLGTRLVHVAPWGGVRAVAWGGLRGWRLLDNPTGLLQDDTLGDATESRHAGQEGGVKVDVSRRWRWLNDTSRLEGGLALQGWFARQRGHEVDLLAERLAFTADDQIGTVTLAAWARGHLGLGGLASISPGVRVEQVELRRRARLDEDAPAFRAGRLIVRPDVAVTLTPDDTVDVHAAWGRGARPPDPRALGRGADPEASVFDVIDGRLAARPAPWLDAGLSAFGILGRDEPLLDPILATPIGRADTRRVGGSLELTVRPPGLPGRLPLALGGTLSFTDARRLDTGDLLAYAPRWTGSVSATIARWNLSTQRTRDLFLGLGVRLQWVGRYPLPDGFTARGFSATDIRATVDWRRWSFRVEVDNAVPWRWRQVEVFLPSRWDMDQRPTALPVRHFVTGRPFALRLAVSRRF